MRSKVRSKPQQKKSFQVVKSETFSRPIYNIRFYIFLFSFPLSNKPFQKWHSIVFVPLNDPANNPLQKWHSMFQTICRVCGCSIGWKLPNVKIHILGKTYSHSRSQTLETHLRSYEICTWIHSNSSNLHLKIDMFK